MRKAIPLLILGFLLTIGAVWYNSKTAGVTEAASHGVGELSTRGIEDVVNQVRVQNGLIGLVDNPLLDEIATERAKYLCANNQWSHDGWMMFIHQFDYKKAGENLEYSGLGQTPGTIVQAWVNSPTHYANMTDPDFREQGMGLIHCQDYQDQTEAVIVVNLFREPR